MALPVRSRGSAVNILAPAARSLERFIWIGLDFLAALVAPLAQKTGVRFFHLDGGRIGDWGAGIASIVHDIEFGVVPRYRAVLVPIPTRRLANPSYMNYWRKYVHIASGVGVPPLAFRLSRRLSLVLPVAGDAHERLTATEQQWEAEGRSPLLVLDPEHERRGRA